MAPKRINSEAIPYHEHSDCLENTSLAEEGTSVFQERDHEHLPAEKGSSGLQDTDHGICLKVSGISTHALQQLKLVRTI